MRSIVYYLAASLTLLLAGCAPSTAGFSQSPTFKPELLSRVAVVVQAPPARRGVTPPIREVEDAFVREVMSHGYSVATRSDVNALEDEVKFQHRGLTDRDTAAEAGRLLNVPAVVIVTITSDQTWHDSAQTLNGNYGTIYMAKAGISARLLDTQTGEVLWSSSDNSVNQVIGPTISLADQVAQRVARSFPYRTLPKNNKGEPFDPRSQAQSSDQPLLNVRWVSINSPTIR